MPRYKIQAPDGKVLTLESAEPLADADFESAVDEYLATKAPAAPAEKSWGAAITENLPFGATAQDIAAGRKPYAGGAEGVGRAAGDIGAAAGLGAGAALLGAAPIAAGVGAGALIGAGLEKAGISPWLREKAQGIRESGVQPTSQSVTLNMLKMAPREALATGVEIVPAAATALLTGLGLKGAGIGAAKAAELPVNAPGAAGALQEAGGRVTPAMVRAAEGKPGGVAAGVESAVRANPLTSGLMRNIDKANVEAIQKTLAAEVPASQMTPATAGGLLESVLEKFQVRRGTAVGEAKKGLAALDAGDVGKVASDKIIKQLQDGGVPFDETGFRPDLMKGTEKMPASTAAALVEAERNIRGATMAQAINFLENFDEAVKGKLQSAYPDKAARATQEARALVKQAIVEKAKEADPALAKALTDADRAYAVSQPTVKAALLKARGETTPTSELVRSVFGRAGSKADKGLRRLKATMNEEEFGQVQDALASEVTRQATGTNGLSLAKLETALKELGENAKYLKPETLAGFKKAADMMRAAGVVELQIPNPSGTAARLTQNILTLGGAAGLGGIFGAPLPVAAGAAGLSGLGAAYMNLPAAARAFRAGVRPPASALSRALAGTSPYAASLGAGLGTAGGSLRGALERAPR